MQHLELKKAFIKSKISIHVRVFENKNIETSASIYEL
jgi:hypothetical protein